MLFQKKFDELHERLRDNATHGQKNVGGFRKIKDAPKPCLNPQHNPPSHIVLSPGTHEYTCPGCGAKSIITVPQIIL
jgi:hypothetical protein